MRKTKIICTMGPATDSAEVLEAMIRSGMNVARFNFSHGEHAEHKKRMNLVRETAEKLGVPIALLLDTKGPEIRIGKLENDAVTVENGKEISLTIRDVIGNAEMLPVNYAGIVKDAKVGCTVLIDDGNIELLCNSVTEDSLRCTVMNGGTIKTKKSVNLPGVKLSMPYLSARDESDLLFGIEQGVDYIAASFVTCASDVSSIRRVLERNHAGRIQIIAKIENMEGVQNIDEILAVSDGIMVARGDMGVEISYDELPRIQKHLIKRAYCAGKRAITATQMLESMIHNPRPTRAEVSDVANAVFDGTSAIMLSGETAVGKHPVESVKAMHSIALKAEQSINYKKRFATADSEALTGTITDAISHATCTTAHDLGAAAIVTVTKTGTTARMISKFRPACDIITLTTDPIVYRQLALSWGVIPVMAEEKKTTDELFDHAVERSAATGLVKNGDLIVITLGVPVGVSGSTNTLKVHVMGNVLVSGRGHINNKRVCGTVCVCRSEAEAREKFKPGDILVIPETSNKIIDVLRSAKAIVTAADGFDSHAAIVGYTLDIPVIVGAPNAISVLKTGNLVTVDAARGIIYGGNVGDHI